MSDLCFSAKLEGLFVSDCFRDATADELKVLLAVLALERRITGVDELSSLSGVSRARVLSAITLWREAGVIRELDAFAELTDEYSKPKAEDTAKTVAMDIRDEGLRELIEECAKTMRREAFSAQEIKAIHSLYMEKSLSAEYIVTLAAYLMAKQKNGELTVRKLAKEGEKLADKGIETLEELEIYFDRNIKVTSEEWEFRRLVGIYKRNLSDTEQEYVRRWWREFGFSSAIIGEAFNLATRDTSNAVSLPYMNAILDSWHKAGCKTVSDCIKESECHRDELRDKKPEKNSKPRAKKEKTADIPKYSTFNVEDALQKALERSYGKKDG